MKVALVYDRVNKWGGAERVLLTLHSLFPDAPLFTSVYHKEKTQWASVFDVRASFLQNFLFATSSHEFYAVLMPLAFESFSFDEFDVVISVTSEAAKGIITKPKTIHICYCLTPTRYLWSGYNEYFNNELFRFISKPAVSYLRHWDLIAAQRPDTYIAISKEVQNRIKKYYGRESEVVYPPVTLATSHQQSTASLRNKRTDGYLLKASGYFLVVSRLVAYKRVDIVIGACNRLKVPLKIVGTGSQESYLRSIAGPTVEFLGQLTDKMLVEYYKGCLALIHAGVEDFGISMVEAQLFGKPVIGFGGGGLLEIIVEGKTGTFFSPQTVDALTATLQRLNVVEYNKSKEFENARMKFSKKKFKEQLLAVIAKERFKRKV